jgi:murein DD-endopeptidase MepM/ murein hydrolase activator NlpD
MALTNPAFRTVDLDVGESSTVRLDDGRSVALKLQAVRERRDDVLHAVRDARARVLVDGRDVTIRSGLYYLPVDAGSVRIDCPITKGLTSNSHIDHWALEKDARLRIWPAGSALIDPHSFAYPLDQRWFATLTWIDNEPVSVPSPTGKVYYHAGVDLGGCEGLVDVLAATDGLVVSARGKNAGALDGSPVESRYDVVYLLDGRGWYYRYSHFESIDDAVEPGRRVKKGQKLGIVGKEGGSGGWTHLHFEIKSRQPSGRWGTQAAYGFLWQAYLREREPKLIAVARPHHLARTGEPVSFDGSLSWSAEGDIASYEWRLSDGTRDTGARVERVYARAGTYSEVLEVRDRSGRIDRDFATVRIVDRQKPEPWPAYIHATYSPTFGIRSGDPVTFKVRSFRTRPSRERWDFGDGSPKIDVRSDGGSPQHRKDGYAVTEHRFAKPGKYVVAVEHVDANGYIAMTHLHVVVGDSLTAPRSER